MSETFNPFTKKPDFLGDGTGSSYITNGSGGVTIIRWRSSGGYIYDMTVADDGTIVTTLVSAPGLPTTGFYLEGGTDFIMLETGDYLLQEA